MAISPEGAPRVAPPWQQKLAAYWRWWTGQLALMVPERFAAFGGSGRVPQLAVEGDTVILVDPKVAGETRVVTSEPARARAALRSLLERAGEARWRARLALGPGDALVRRVAMPAATEENLGPVLGFEMDRLTPFRADEVYFDHRVVSRDAAAGTIGVLLVVARRDLVDLRVQQLRSLGIGVEGVTLRDDVPAGVPVNLLPAGQRGEQESPRQRLIKRALAAAVVLLLLAVLLYPPWAKRESIIALHPVEQKTQSEAQATDKLARELERLVAEHNFLLAKKHAQPPALAYIEEVTRLLPDNTWVQQLDLKQAGKVRELQIQGETASSSKLIEILEQSTLLQNAAPRGTVTRGSVPGTERFVIAAETKGRPLPEPTPVAQLSTPIAPPPAAGAKPPEPAKGADPAKPAPPAGNAAPADPAKGAPAPAKVEPVPTPPPGSKRSRAQGD